MRARRPVRLLTALGALTLGCAGSVVGVGGLQTAYAADTEYSCVPITSDATPSQLESAAPDPFKGQLQIEAAQDAAGPRPGSGVTVAVIDSGIDARQIAAKVVPPPAGFEAPAVYSHGTTVAGIIAGKRSGDSVGGIAPDVTLLDFPVWRKPADEGSDPGGVQDSEIVHALQLLAGKPGRLDHLIVNMSLAVTMEPDSKDDPYLSQLRGAIRALTQRGAIVVAAGGNRQGDQVDSSASPSPYTGTEDHADDTFPAGFPEVVAVGASYTAGTDGAVGDPVPYVLANSQIDVAAPTVGIRSWTAKTQHCAVNDVATSWSTPVVSGTLALLWTKYPRAHAPEILRRLEDTATGRVDQPGMFTGAGVVQPYDALTRPLGPPESSRPQTVPRASVAPPRADVLKGTRHDAMWWGLLGGGALILALLLRPLFARRRDS